MPYDPRPVFQGGNRGIDEEFSRRAPPGKFRVIGVDTFDGGDWVDGDYDTLEEAIKKADEKGKNASMLKLHVYDDTGEHLHEAGSF